MTQCCVLLFAAADYKHCPKPEDKVWWGACRIQSTYLVTRHLHMVITGKFLLTFTRGWFSHIHTIDITISGPVRWQNSFCLNSKKCQWSVRWVLVCIAYPSIVLRDVKIAQSLGRTFNALFAIMSIWTALFTKLGDDSLRWLFVDSGTRYITPLPFDMSLENAKLQVSIFRHRAMHSYSPCPVVSVLCEFMKALYKLGPAAGNGTIVSWQSALEHGNSGFGATVGQKVSVQHVDFVSMLALQTVQSEFPGSPLVSARELEAGGTQCEQL